MLYAARAALSEEDLGAKTDSGTWNLVGSTFVDAGRFERELFEQARRTQRVREAADYDAASVSPGEAASILALAERFLASMRRLVGG